jgi:hypothetical protein
MRMEGGKQIVHLHQLLFPAKTHREDMTSSERLVQVHLAKALVKEVVNALPCEQILPPNASNCPEC